MAPETHVHFEEADGSLMKVPMPRTQSKHSIASTCASRLLMEAMESPRSSAYLPDSSARVPTTSDSGGPSSPRVSRNPSISCLVRLTSEQASVLFPRSLRLWREIVESPYMSNMNPADIVASLSRQKRKFVLGPSLSEISSPHRSREPPNSVRSLPSVNSSARLSIRCLSPRRCKENKENIIRETILPATLVAIHGLLTGLDNLLPLGRAVAPPLQRFVSLSPRNYENSPWDDDDSSEAHLQDLGRALYEERKRPDCPVVGLLGHSLGGTRSMILALRRPELVDFLIVFDIAPMSYIDQKLRMALRLWLAVPLMLQHRRGAISSVDDADKAIAAVDPWISKVNRKFIMPLFSQPDEHREKAHSLGDIEPTKDKKVEDQMFNFNYDLCGSDDHLQDLFHWPCELEDSGGTDPMPMDGGVVVDTLEEVGSNEGGKTYVKVKPFLKPALFLRGGRSPKYMPREADANIRKFFPNADIKLIDGASHLIHMDKPREVAQVVKDWIRATLTAHACTS